MNNAPALQHSLHLALSTTRRACDGYEGLETRAPYQENAYCIQTNVLISHRRSPIPGLRSPTHLAQPANSLSTTVAGKAFDSRDTTYSKGTMFIPSRIGVMTSTSAIVYNALSSCDDQGVQQNKRLNQGSLQSDTPGDSVGLASPRSTGSECFILICHAQRADKSSYHWQYLGQYRV